MDYEVSESQAALIEGLDSLLSRYRGDRLPETFFEYDQGLIKELNESGYLNVARTEGCGPLEAALLMCEVVQLARVVEVGGSMLIAPQMGLDGEGPYAVTSWAEIRNAIRFLPVARRLLIEDGDNAYEMIVDQANVEPGKTVLAYPFGRLKAVPDLAKLRKLAPGSGPKLRAWRRVALAIEVWGAANSALWHTVEYVKERQVFGRPLGTYQAVHHRLALVSEQIAGARFLALKAAYSGDSADAAIAATHVQAAIPQFMWDLHQFNGAQGWTLANPLHFWTFRLRALQGEMGGPDQQALAVAEACWG